jgi:hypothetical protein
VIQTHRDGFGPEGRATADRSVGVENLDRDFAVSVSSIAQYTVPATTPMDEDSGTPDVLTDHRYAHALEEGASLG